MEFLLLAFFSFCQQITEESDSHRLLVPVGAQDLVAVAKEIEMNK